LFLGALIQGAPYFDFFFAGFFFAATFLVALFIDLFSLNIKFCDFKNRNVIHI